MQPTFLLIGAGKCGTSSLCHYLSQHPDVFISDPKEPGYFTQNNARGWQWYSSLFVKGKRCQAIGEATVNYSKSHLYPLAAERIAKALPKVQIIYLTRHPLRRIESEWKYKTLKGEEKRPFNTAILAEPDYIETSNYKKQLAIFRKYYADEHIKVLFLEDLQHDAQGVLQACFGFLGVDCMQHNIDLKPRNIGSKAVSISRIVRLMRELPGFEVIRHYLPNHWRRNIRYLLSKQMADIHALREPLIWDADVLAEVIQRLRPDSEAFLSDCEKAKDFWNLEKNIMMNSKQKAVD